jgi:hypothetical protein
MQMRKALALAALSVLPFLAFPLHADDRVLWDQGPTAEAAAIGATPYLPWRADLWAGWSAEVSIPAFRDPGIVYDSNYVRIGASVRASWDAAEAAAEIRLEPFAFAHLRLGGGIGTGWSIPALGRIGLAINPSNDAQPLKEIPLGGFVWNAWASIPLSLNLEYFLLSPWWRVVLEVEPRVEYKALSAAAPGEAWLWHDDMGMNFNGLRFSVSGFFGWRPPVVAGIQEVGIEGSVKSWPLEVWSSSPSGSDGWGSDVLLMEVGGRMRFALDPWDFFLLRLSFGNGIEWTPASVTAHRYFGNRSYSGTAFAFTATLSYHYAF